VCLAQDIDFIRHWSATLQADRDKLHAQWSLACEEARKPLRTPSQGIDRAFQKQRDYDDKRRLARREAEREVERINELARIHVSLVTLVVLVPSARSHLTV
jgi:hypothetical protein